MRFNVWTLEQRTRTRIAMSGICSFISVFLEYLHIICIGYHCWRWNLNVIKSYTSKYKTTIVSFFRSTSSSRDGGSHFRRVASLPVRWGFVLILWVRYNLSLINACICLTYHDNVYGSALCYENFAVLARGPRGPKGEKIQKFVMVRGLRCKMVLSYFLILTKLKNLQ